MKNIRIFIYLIFGAFVTIIWFGVVMHQSSNSYQVLIVGEKVYSQEVGVAFWYVLVGLVGVLLSYIDYKIFNSSEKAKFGNFVTWFWSYPIGSFVVSTLLTLLNIDVLILNLFQLNF